MKFLASLLAGLLAASSLAAQQNPVLSWRDYEAQLFQKNLTLLSSRATVTASAFTRDATGGTAWPALSLGAGASYGQTGSAPAGDSYSYSLSASYTLFDGGATNARIRAADINLSLAQLNGLKTWIDIRSTAKLTYLEASFTEEKIKLLSQILERLKRNEDFMRVKYEGGQEARWVYLRAKNSRLDTEQQLIATKRAWRQARKQLALLLGQNEINPEFELEALPPSNRVPDDVNYSAWVSANLNVLQAKKNIQNAQAQLELASADLWPTLSLKGSSGLSGTPAFFPGTSNWTAGLNLSLELFDANVRGNSIAARQMDLLSARINYSQAWLDAQQSVLGAHNSFTDVAERLPLVLDAQKIAQERLDTIEQLYLSGRSIYLEWDQAQQALTQAQTSVLESRYQLSRALTNLEKALQIR